MAIKTIPIKPSRHRIGIVGGSEQVEIPANRNWFALPFLLFWITAWTAGGVMALSSLLASFQPFLLIWLLFWALGWVFAGSSILWQLLGREVVRVANGQLIHGCHMPLWQRDRGYPVHAISRLSTDRGMSSFERMQFQTPLFTFGRVGVVKFDYGARTVRMGAAIDEAEGSQIVDWLAKRLPASSIA